MERRHRNSTKGPKQASLHNRVAVLRTEHGLSRHELAEAVGVNYQTIGYIERGEYSPSLDLAFRLAEVFELPIEAIFSRRPMRPMSQQLFTPVPDPAMGPGRDK
ncbi:MAG: helix-turn-helix transcriptional regulator [Candidatus Dormiibacterota bacterium]